MKEEFEDKIDSITEQLAKEKCIKEHHVLRDDALRVYCQEEILKDPEIVNEIATQDVYPPFGSDEPESTLLETILDAYPEAVVKWIYDHPMLLEKIRKDFTLMFLFAKANNEPKEESYVPMKMEAQEILKSEVFLPKMELPTAIQIKLPVFDYGMYLRI